MRETNWLLRSRWTPWVLGVLAVVILGLLVSTLIGVSRTDRVATDAVVAIAALMSSVAAVMALLQSSASTDRQAVLLERADAVEVRRALPLLGIALPELNADGSVTFRILNETPSVAVNVNLYIDSHGAYGEVAHSSQVTWSAIPASERKKWVPDGLVHPYEEIVLRLHCEGILGGSIEQTWVATGSGGFDRRIVEILPELPAVA